MKWEEISFAAVVMTIVIGLFGGLMYAATLTHQCRMAGIAAKMPAAEIQTVCK